MQHTRCSQSLTGNGMKKTFAMADRSASHSGKLGEDTIRIPTDRVFTSDQWDLSTDNY